MSYLREYIRHCLFEGTYAFGEHPLTYNPQEVLIESSLLKEGFDDVIHKSMDLAYFNKNFDNEVDGAAWICDDGMIFEFFVITSENAPNCVFESLVRDCMDEYSTLKFENDNLKLEIKVEDDETEKHLSDVYGLSIIGHNENVAIMGYRE